MRVCLNFRGRRLSCIRHRAVLTAHSDSPSSNASVGLLPPPTQERTPSTETMQPLTSSGYDVCASPLPLCHPHTSFGYPFSCVPCIVRQMGNTINIDINAFR